MFFEEVSNLTTVVELEEVRQNPDMIYHHFMNYGDEVFYIMENKKIYGIVTPGDLYRSYTEEQGIYINRKFKYITSVNDFNGAKEIFDKYPTIHEVAVVENDEFLGVIKSGKRKTAAEWCRIRFSFGSRDEIQDFEIREIRKLLELKSHIFVYPYLSMVSDEISFTNTEQNFYHERVNCLVGLKDINLLTEKEQIDFFGEYSWKHRTQLSELWGELKLIYKNGIPKYKDTVNNPMYTIKDGCRIVPGAPTKAQKRIYTVGPCTVLGAYVANEETIQAYLQEKLIENNFEDYQVINLSVASELSIARLFSEEISADDIVIIMTNKHTLWSSFENQYAKKLTCIKDLGSVWNEIENPVGCIYESYNHCNWRVNKAIAQKMFKDIQGSLSKETKIIKRQRLQDYYISPSIAGYYKRHFMKYANEKAKGRVGGIVMNCNPFTKGHRYLIEQAASQVNYLYVFVVQEDRSVFSFEDRYQMVKKGTEDIENVGVLPSGEYLISSKTFEQYFRKDQVETVDNMDYDVRIFGEVVAEEFGIQVRFVGEEPYDKVTNEYNQTMKRILPTYGIEVIEIPRVSSNAGEIISASKVRKYLQQNNAEALKMMLPISTLEYLSFKK